jgi:hypothetical protein
MSIKASLGWPFLYMSVNDQESLNVHKYQHGPWSQQKKHWEASPDHFNKSFSNLDIK